MVGKKDNREQRKEMEGTSLKLTIHHDTRLRNGTTESASTFQTGFMNVPLPRREFQ